MDEIKVILDLVQKLPELGVWVIVAIYAYKVVIIGSIYGLIRLAINQTHSWLTRDKKTEFVIGHKVIDATVGAALNAQLTRLGSYGYIHASDIIKLAQAIDVIKEKESK